MVAFAHQRGQALAVLLRHAELPAQGHGAGPISDAGHMGCGQMTVVAGDLAQRLGDVK